MEKRRLGASQIEASVIGLGTWLMGGEWWGPSDDDESVRTIHRAFDIGINLIDTAAAYGNGHAEEVVGLAIKGTNRDDIVIVDKVLPDSLAGPEGVQDSFETAVRRLGTDYIDVYFVHWPRDDFPMENLLGEMQSLKEAGKIRAIGLSNFSVDEIDRARRVAGVDVIQHPYNLLWRAVESEHLPYCEEHGIGFMAYSSLAQGLLTGEIDRGTVFKEGDKRTTTVLFQDGNLERSLDAVEILRGVAARCGQSPAQTALTWLLTREAVTTALLGARTPLEVDESAGGLGWALSEADLGVLDEVAAVVASAVEGVPDMFNRWKRSSAT